jgi:hypothetical protein
MLKKAAELAQDGLQDFSNASQGNFRNYNANAVHNFC